MKKSRTKCIVGSVVGALLLLLSPLVAYCGYRVGMNRGYAALAAPGVGDPKAISGSIDTALYSTMGGCAGFLVGIIVLTLSIIAYRRAVRAAG